jgi:hypothetical protein
MAISHLHLHVRDRGLAESFYRRWFRLATQSSGGEITFMTADGGFLRALMDDPAPYIDLSYYDKAFGTR